MVSAQYDSSTNASERQPSQCICGSKRPDLWWEKLHNIAEVRIRAAADGVGGGDDVSWCVLSDSFPDF